MVVNQLQAKRLRDFKRKEKQLVEEELASRAYTLLGIGSTYDQYLVRTFTSMLFNESGMNRINTLQLLGTIPKKKKKGLLLLLRENERSCEE